MNAARASGTLHPDDLPPVLPDWLDEVWVLFERVRSQVRSNGAIDYNPVIKLAEVAGAAPQLWRLLEFIQVIESEVMRTETPTGGE